jgi:hypothetical protein
VGVILTRGIGVGSDPLGAGSSHYEAETHPHITLGMTNPRLDCLIIGSWTLWTLGYPEQALKWSRESVGRATEMSYSFSLAFALSMAAIFQRHIAALRKAGLK